MIQIYTMTERKHPDELENLRKLRNKRHFVERKTIKCTIIFARHMSWCQDRVSQHWDTCPGKNNHTFYGFSYFLHIKVLYCISSGSSSSSSTSSSGYLSFICLCNAVFDVYSFPQYSQT